MPLSLTPGEAEVRWVPRPRFLRAGILTFSAVWCRRSTGIHFCTSGQFPALLAQTKIRRDRRFRTPFAQRYPPLRLRGNTAPRATVCPEPSFAKGHLEAALPRSLVRKKRKNTSLQVLCLPLLRTPCRASPFPATHTQTPGMGVPRSSSSPTLTPLCALCLCGKSGGFIRLRTLHLSCAFFRTAILCFQSLADSSTRCASASP